MAIVNRIVTRGLGQSRGAPGRAGPITQGLGGPPSFFVETLARRVHGRSGKRPENDLYTIVLWAKLMEVNGHAPTVKISGSVTVPISKSSISIIAERVSVGVKSAWNDIKVTAKRVTRR